MPRKDEPEGPSNDNLDPDTPWQRAQLILEAHASISKSDIHPYDAPGRAIRALLIDIMHYCDTLNIGKQKGNSEYVDFDRELKAASKDFQVQAKMMNSVMDKAVETYAKRIENHIAETFSPAPSPPVPLQQRQLHEQATPENDPKLAKIIVALQERQAHESRELAERQAREPFEDNLRHEHESDSLLRKFEDERERYIRQYNKGLDMAERLREDEEKEKSFEQDLSQ